MKPIITTVLILITGCLSLPGQGVIVNRTALEGMIGPHRADEGFETLPIPDNSGVGSDALLSATNSWGGNGLGLVVPGITIESPFTLQWIGNNSRGAITRTIAGMGELWVDFWNPTTAFGVDVKDYAFGPRNFIGGVTVYGADDLTILYTDNNIVLTNGNPALGIFFGYQHSGGIGKVQFFTVEANPLDPGYSPQIDNLSFSTAPIPEPSTVAIALLGLSALASRFRKM